MVGEFQSTPPHGGRLLQLPHLLFQFLFQSTPPHGGRHFNLDYLLDAYMVSIHAPAWGATTSTDGGKKLFDGFNPRPRMGGDI